MGNFRVGWVYPPSIKLGATNVRKVMCGNEQVWPKNQGIIVQYERYGTDMESEGFYITIPKSGFLPPVEGVCWFEETSYGYFYMYLVDPTGEHNVGKVTELIEDVDNWTWEWDEDNHAVRFKINNSVFEQTDYTLQRISVEFGSEMQSFELMQEIDDTTYGGSVMGALSPDAVYDGGEDYWGNRYLAFSMGELGHVRLEIRHNTGYPLVGIVVTGLNANDYVVHLDEEYVEILPHAFCVIHEYAVEVKWVYGKMKMLYVNVDETFHKAGSEDIKKTLNGNVSKFPESSTVWFDEPSGSGLSYTANSIGDYLFINVPTSTTGYYTIEDFANRTSYYNVGCDGSRVRIPLEYLVENPTEVPQLNLRWTLVYHDA